MGRLLILGSGYAIPEEGHENTHFLIQEGQSAILVDCGSNPVVPLERAGINLSEINDIVLTHFHPDHVSGLPIFLMDLWLLGRKEPINIFGLLDTIERMQAMMNLYEWQRWPGFFPVHYHVIPEIEMCEAIATPGIKIITSPVKHLIPTIGLRVEFLTSGKSAAYSCDTEPCQQVTDLAMHAEILIHEATGESIGHSSASQAAQIASKAGVKQLYLIHYQSKNKNLDPELDKAREIFPGQVLFARDSQVLDL